MTSSPSLDAPAIEAVLVEALSKRLRMPAAELDLDADLVDLGMDSLQAVELATELEPLLGREVDHVVFFDFPTVRSVAAELAGGG